MNTTPQPAPAESAPLHQQINSILRSCSYGLADGGMGFDHDLAVSELMRCVAPLVERVKELEGERDRYKGDWRAGAKVWLEAQHASLIARVADLEKDRERLAEASAFVEERERQKKVEGWSEAHDDEHDGGQLAKAAGCYALRSNRNWPWDLNWYKPTPDDRKRELVKAGALLLAEIERLDRCAARAKEGAT